MNQLLKSVVPEIGTLRCVGVHSDLHRMNLYPCAYSLTLNVIENKLNAILNQRSQDMLVANNWNVCQYSALVHMFAQVSGLEAGEFVHVIADAHIYDRHIDMIEEMIALPQHDAPKFAMNGSVKDFYKFSTSDFSLIDYKYNRTGFKILVAE